MIFVENFHVTANASIFIDNGAFDFAICANAQRNDAFIAISLSLKIRLVVVSAYQQTVGNSTARFYPKSECR